MRFPMLKHKYIYCMTNYFYNMEKYNYHSILYMYIFICVCICKYPV